MSGALAAVVRAVLAAGPAWVLAKGGITAHDVATVGLGIRRAEVAGQLFPGVISVLRPVDAAPEAIGLPYVVFAGNVGDDGTLAERGGDPRRPAGGSLMRVGWLGLGAMGAPMAACLARAGHQVLGYDVVAERAVAAAGGGVHPAASIGTAVRDADVAVLMVATPGQLEGVLFGPGGAAGAVPASAVILIMATAGPEAVVSAAGRLAARGIAVVDAPVSGVWPGRPAAIC